MASRRGTSERLGKRKVEKDKEETGKTSIGTWFGPSGVFLLRKECKDQVHYEQQKQGNFYAYEGGLRLWVTLLQTMPMWSDQVRVSFT